MPRLQEGKNLFFEFFSAYFSSLFMICYAFSIFTVVFFFFCARASHKTRITEWKISAGQSYRFILLQRMNSAAGIKLQEFALFLVLIKTGGLFYSVSCISQLTHISVREVAAALWQSGEVWNGETAVTHAVTSHYIVGFWHDGILLESRDIVVI